MGNKSSLMLQDEEITRINQETGFSPSQIVKLYTRFTHLDRTNCGALTKDDLISIPELALNPLCERLLEMFFSGTKQETERINFVQFMEVLANFRPSTDDETDFVHRNEWPTHVNVVGHSNVTGRTQAETSSTIDGTMDINQRSRGGRKYENESRISLSDKPRGVQQLATGSSPSTEPKSNIIHSGKLPPLNLSNGLRRKLLFVFQIYDADNDGRISFADLRSILKMMVGSFIEDVQLDKITTRAFVEVDIDNDGYIEFSEFCNVFCKKDLDDRLRVKFFN